MLKVFAAVLVFSMAVHGVFSKSIAEEKEVVLSRNKRAMYLNKDAPILIAAYITIPISVALGKFARSMRGFDNMTDDIVPGSYDDPLYKSELHKLDLYFEYLRVTSDMCRQRFLCELASSPSTYEPIYDIFAKQLRDHDNEVEPSYSSRYFRYANAFSEGSQAAKGDSSHPESVCADLYGTCPVPANELLSLTRVKILQFLTTFLKIRLEDV